MSDGLPPIGSSAGGRPGLHVEADLDLTLGSHNFRLESNGADLVFKIPGMTAALELGKTAYQLGYLRNLEGRAHQLNHWLEFCQTQVRVTMYGKTLVTLGQDAPATWVNRLTKTLGWDLNA
jgi:hypothetical protein